MPTIRDFKVEKSLGKGTYGCVFRVRRLSDGKFYAMKQIDIKKMSSKERKAAVNEIRILASLNCPYIIRFYEAFIENDKLHIVTDYASYGDLFRQMKKHASRNTMFSERAVWSFFLQLVIGIKYLHDQGILHRDLKAANIFIDSEGCLKIGDFGISKILRPGSMFASDQIGSPYYVSPEMWRKQPYDTKSDMWAIGCFLYELIALHPPFQAENMEDLSKKIMTGRFEPLPASTSPDLQRLVRRLLTLEPKARPDITELLSMPVIQDHLNLLPSVPKSSRHVATKPQEEFMDLRNTIHTPRRMNDMKHLLPAETRYHDSEAVATENSRRKERERRKREKAYREEAGEEDSSWRLPPLQPSHAQNSRRDGRSHNEGRARTEHVGRQRGVERIDSTRSHGSKYPTQSKYGGQSQSRRHGDQVEARSARHRSARY